MGKTKSFMISEEHRKAFTDLVDYAVDVDPCIEEIWLMSVNNELGLLYVDTYSENLDNHCQQCMDELLPIGLGHEVLRKYICMSVGKTKFARIQSGELKIAQQELKLLERLI